MSESKSNDQSLELSEWAQDKYDQLSSEDQAKALEKFQNMQAAFANVSQQPALTQHISAMKPKPVQEIEPSSGEVILTIMRENKVSELDAYLKNHGMSVNSAVSAPGDKEAHPLLHWAALNDHVESVKFLLTRSVQVNQRNPRGEVALHWAALNGHIRCVHLLLEGGADIQLGDARGYTAMHHAAQFGHVVVMAMLLRRGLDIDLRDNSGRTPLHWATYKAHDIAISWLLAHGANIHAVDYEDCLPLHWAALQGFKNISRTLIERGGYEQLALKDRTGGTPKALAAEKMGRFEPKSYEHTQFEATVQLMEYCEKSKKLPSNVDSMMKNHPTWYAWPVLAPIAWWQYFTVIFPETSFHTYATIIFWIFYWFEWACWIALQRSDPGGIVTLPRKENTNSSAVQDSSENVAIVRVKDFRDRDVVKTTPRAAEYRQMYEEVLERGLLVPVCTTCEIVKPLRSKHDRVTDRCILKFDHFCPFMGVAVGQNNYRLFCMVLVNAVILIASWHYLVIRYTSYYDKTEGYWSNFKELWLWELYTLVYAPIMVYALVMVGQHSYFIKKNITTNETINKSRLSYLGFRRNPFDRGFLKNYMEFFGILEPIEVNFRIYYETEFAGGAPPPAVVNTAARHGHSHGGKECHGHS